MFVSKWIDIKEQEPADGQECLICTKQNKISKAKWCAGEGYSDKTQHGCWQASGGCHNAALYWMPLPYPPDLFGTYSFEDDNFGAVIISAIRYACGRQSYMPSLVVGVVHPMLPMLNDKTIACMERDIREADKFGGYGDEIIDKPLWMSFLAELQRVMEERSIERW